MVLFLCCHYIVLVVITHVKTCVYKEIRKWKGKKWRIENREKRKKSSKISFLVAFYQLCLTFIYLVIIFCLNQWSRKYGNETEKRGKKFSFLGAFFPTLSNIYVIFTSMDIRNQKQAWFKSFKQWIMVSWSQIRINWFISGQEMSV